MVVSWFGCRVVVVHYWYCVWVLAVRLVRRVLWVVVICISGWFGFRMLDVACWLWCTVVGWWVLFDLVVVLAKLFC